MKSIIHNSWQHVLSDEFSKPYFSELDKFVCDEYDKNSCYPPEKQIFASLATDFSSIKVVILGQDPYHGPKQANGFCFSVNDSCPFPPSLRNIFKEVSSDIGTEIPENGNLERWARQGVLLLNSVLTVRENEPGSHARKGWETFTDAIIRIISEQNENVVFMLWGAYAKKKVKLINSTKHLILESGHPSPLSANQGLWFKNSHFSKANDYLKRNKKEPIIW